MKSFTIYNLYNRIDFLTKNGYKIAINWTLIGYKMDINWILIRHRNLHYPLKLLCLLTSQCRIFFLKLKKMDINWI